MEKTRVVITGVGVVAPNGIGKEVFWKNCLDGVSGIKPITLFDASAYRCRYAGEITDFDPASYVGKKGLRNLDRTTKLALVAAKLAIDDAQLDVSDSNRNDVGVVLGSTMGSVHSICEFDRIALREGPRSVNPAHFPNTVINSPASQVAIRYGLKAINSTIATGFSAGIDAIGYARDMLILGRAKTLLVGGVEEFCLETFLGFYKLGMLATKQDGSMPLFEPFHEKASGTILGEGSVFFVMETLASAKARGAEITAELIGYSNLFHPDSMYQVDPEVKGPVQVVQEALDDAGINSDDIDIISSCANSHRAFDTTEMTTIDKIFGSRADEIDVINVKSLIGESFSAGSIFQVAGALEVFSRQKTAAPAANQQQTGFSTSSVSQAVSELNENTTSLINAFAPTGICSALVIQEGSE